MDHTYSFSIYRKLGLCPLLLGLSACMVGPDFEHPVAPDIDTYTENPLPAKTTSASHTHGGAAQTFVVGADLPEEWWELFQSEELNALVERGLENSPDLIAAEATLRQAEEELSVLTGQTMYPAIGLDLFAGREQLSALDSLEGSPGETLADFPTQQLSLYNANVDVFYVLDVFGGNRRAIESLRAEVDFERFQLEATYIALTANIVTTAIAEASLRSEIRATREIIEHETKLLDIINKQYHVGSVSQVEILEQETVLAQTRAELPALENELAQTRHALAVLVGSYPSDPDFCLFLNSMLCIYPRHCL